MNKDLYYCKDWKHQFYKGYDICVSDFVEDGSGVLLQIHCAVFRDNEVVRAKSVSKFQRNVRDYVRAFIDKMGMCEPGRDEARDVRMWYYTPDGGDCDKDEIPLRIAITFYRPKKIEDKEQIILKEQIFTELCDLLL